MSAALTHGPARASWALGGLAAGVLPVMTVLMAIIAIWYGASVMMNRAWTLDQMQRQNIEMTPVEIIAATMTQ